MTTESDTQAIIDGLRCGGAFLRKRALDGIVEAMTSGTKDWHRADQLKACAQALRDANTLAGEANMLDAFPA